MARRAARLVSHPTRPIPLCSLSICVDTCALDGAVAASKQTGLIVLGLSLFKVRLVIRHFMEVAHAPIALKLVADGWLLIVCGVVVGMYLRF